MVLICWKGRAKEGKQLLGLDSGQWPYYIGRGSPGRGGSCLALDKFEINACFPYCVLFWIVEHGYK